MPGAQRNRCGHTAKWYAIQVDRGRERAMASLLTRVAGEGVLAEPAFQPRFETEIKVRGRYVRVTKPLVEGYVIAVAADAEALEKSLSLVTERVRLLGTADGPAPLSAEEVALFGGLGEAGSRVLPMSIGYKLADGSVAIECGPLAGRESLIARIDRRKSVAELTIEVSGEVITARAGLAVLPMPTGDPSFERRIMRRRTRIHTKDNPIEVAA